MRKLLLALVIVGGLAAIAAPITAWRMDESYGIEVQMIVPHAPEVAAMEQLLADENTPVTSLHGEALGPPVRLVLFDQTGLIRPPQDPKLALLPVDKQQGDNPLQAKTVWFAAKWASIGSGAFVLLVLGLWAAFFRSRRAS